MNEPLNRSDLETLDRLGTVAAEVAHELSHVIVGQHEPLEQMLLCLLAGGHSLLVGVPGLAKTLMIQSLAQVLNLPFRRIQFTPDLMPADITGTEVLEENRSTGERSWRFLAGPLFASLVLADEINRTPPKTQAALLEAMQERQVTVGGIRHALPDPFFVMATQNPIEQEGTYPLPEAQADRFMFQILLDYPNPEEELKIILETTSDRPRLCKPLLDGDQLKQLMQIVRRIPIAEPVARLAMNIARATRPTDPLAPESVRKCVSWGAGPRASQYLVLGAKARAAMQNRPMVEEQDVLAVATPVLRHRMRTNFHAEAEGISISSLLDDVLTSLSNKSMLGKQGDYLRQIFRS